MHPEYQNWIVSHGDRAGARLVSSAGAGQAHPHLTPAGRGCSTPSYKMRQSSWQIFKKKNCLTQNESWVWDWSCLCMKRLHLNVQRRGACISASTDTSTIEAYQSHRSDLLPLITWISLAVTWTTRETYNYIDLSAHVNGTWSWEW